MIHTLMKQYQVKVKLERIVDDNPKIVTEEYFVGADTFGMAEAMVMEKLFNQTHHYEITAIALKGYEAVISEDNEHTADKWFEVKAEIMSLNSRNGKGEKMTALYLVNAASTKDAERVYDVFATLSDTEVKRIAETKVVDVIDYPIVVL